MRVLEDKVTSLKEELHYFSKLMGSTDVFDKGMIYTCVSNLYITFVISFMFIKDSYSQISYILYNKKWKVSKSNLVHIIV